MIDFATINKRLDTTEDLIRIRDRQLTILRKTIDKIADGGHDSATLPEDCPVCIAQLARARVKGLES